ncbi:3-hydroxyisobutyrate dehydrogenase [Paraburkholderia sp. GAS334]|uniref:3-hydroxyisobutyrate dehydrogenase n=1 Tax=Paraburkholderia sp. GAS334 TaxID=3035131 RepID=UPI003D1A091A
MKIGFIGLGKMGAPMVANLLKQGVEVAVYDVNVEAVASAVAAGAGAADSPKAVAVQSGAVVTALPSVQHVADVYLSEEGILAGARPGTLLVDCSTVSPQFSREMWARAAEAGVRMADAPMSGGTKGAGAGTLTFLVGADDALLADIEPLLMKMGKKVVHCGGPGSGQVVKLCNNLLLANTMIATCEAMSLGVKLGVDPLILATAINNSSGRSWSSDTNNPWPGVVPDAPSSNGYAGGGSTETLLKDICLAVQAAQDVKQTLVLGLVAKELYQSSVSQGWGGKDFSSVIHLFD